MIIEIFRETNRHYCSITMHHEGAATGRTRYHRNLCHGCIGWFCPLSVREGDKNTTDCAWSERPGWIRQIHRIAHSWVSVCVSSPWAISHLNHAGRCGTVLQRGSAGSEARVQLCEDGRWETCGSFFQWVFLNCKRTWHCVLWLWLLTHAQWDKAY